MKNEIFKRTAAFGLAVFLTLTSTPVSMVTAFAAPVSGSEESVMAASTVSSGSSAVQVDGTGTESPDTGAEIVKVKTAEEFADQIAEVPKDSRIMIRTDEELSGVISSGEAVQMQDVAIASFDTDAEKNQAVSELEQAGISVSEDDLVTIQDEGGSTPESVKNGTGKKVALIDTGVNGIETIDLTGEGTHDGNGHGTRMAQAIEEAADGKADILSIKAIGADGKGSLSNVYAAIKVAMEQGAEIINLSFNMADNDNTKEAKALIGETIASGITVVAAAGNQGADASSYFPGNIAGVMTAGACDKDAHRLATSNYGNVIDKYVVAESTSIAAAKLSGFLAAGKTDTTSEVYLPEKIVEEDQAEEKIKREFGKDAEIVTRDGKRYVRAFVPESTAPEGMEEFALDDEVQIAGVSDSSIWETIDYSELKKSYDAYVASGYHLTVPSDPTRYGAYTTSGYMSRSTAASMAVRSGTVHSGGYTKINWAVYNFPCTFGGGLAAFGSATLHCLDHTAIGPENMTFNCYAIVTALSEDAATVFIIGIPGNPAEAGVVNYPVGADGVARPAYTGYQRLGASFNVKITPPSGNLQIKKIVSDGDQNREFTVNVHVDGASGQYDYTGSRSGKVSFDGNGNASLTISGGQTITINGLPKDAAYNLTETMPDDYHQVTASGTTGKIVSGQTVTGSFTNKQDGYLQIKKIVRSGDQNREFTVSIHVDGASGEHAYTGSRSGKVSFDGNGNASLTLSGGQSVTIGGLPKDAAYTLTETMPDDYYQVTASGTTGTIIAGQTVTGAFTNEQYGYVYLHKVSGDKNLTEKNSCYSLKGATYGLYDSKGTLVHTLTTDENGDTEIVNVVPGDYTAKELQASTGYMKDGQPHTVHVTSANTKEHPAEITSSEPPINEPVEWKLQKQDAEVGDLTQGLTSLENAKFTVTFYSGYFDSESAAESAVKSGSVTKRTWYLVTKYDADRKAYIASLDPDHLDPDKKSDAFYRNQSKQITFPRGTFWVKETQAPEGYNNDSALSGATKLIRIEKGGDAQTGLNQIIPYAVAKNSNKVEDNPIRADFHLTKLDIDGNAKPYTPFWIIAYNKDGKEVERHLVVSDANGVISTASSYSYEAPDGSGSIINLNKPHNQETISKLEALEKEVKNNVLSAAGEAKLKEAANWGVWFSQGLDKDENAVNGSKAVPNNSRPACYYGSYRVVEIQCASNRGKQENLMDSGIFSLTKEGTNYKEATIIDTEIRLTSVASNADDDGTETKTVAEGENISIRDRISYTHVTAGKPYRMELSIVDLDDLEGNSPKVLATTTKNFTPKKINGTKNTSGSMTMTLSGIDTVGREGHALLAVVRLHQFVSNGASVNETKADVIVAEHGVEQNDPREKVYVPKMHTTAEDALTGDHVGARDKKDAVKDTVELTDLAPKTNYKLVMTLIDKSTGKPLTDTDGKELSVEKNFNTESEDFKPSRTSTIPASTEEDEDTVLVDAVSGKVEMPELVLDSTNLFGKTIIVTETLYQTDSKGKLTKGVNPIHVHPDWHTDQTEVESQSIHYPDLATNAIDGHRRADNLYQVGTGDQVGTVGQTTFSDIVKVTNLLPGMSYKVSGVLLDRQASEEAGMPVAYTYTDAEGKEQTVTQETVITVSKDGREIKASNGENTTASYSKEKNSTSGTVELIFTLDATDLAGKDLVAAEMLFHSYKNGTDKDKKDEIPVAEHKNYEDRDQMVYYPNIGTKAMDEGTSDHVGTVGGKTVIKDTVSFANLLAGKTYAIRGRLMDQQTGTALLDKDGKEITAATVLNITTDHVVTANQADIDARSIVINPEDGIVSGEVTLSFELDSSLLSNRTVVVFEKLYHDAAYKADMQVEDVNEKDTVVKHEEIKDKGQSVQYPGISTSAVDQDTGDHAGSIWGALINGVRRLFGDKDADKNGIPDDRQQNITDTVSLTDLVPGMTYVVSGKLYDKDASEEAGKNVPLTVNGKEIIQHDTITVSEDGTKIVSANGNKTSVTDNNTELRRVDGSVDLTFSLDSSLTQGKDMVVFETLYHDNSYTKETDSETPKEEDKVNEHHDIHDEDQTVSDVSIRTYAIDRASASKTGTVPSEGNPSVLVDDVHMAKLVPGMDYTIKGYLVVLNRSDLEKGKVLFLKADGTLTQDPEEAISQTCSFKAEKTEESKTLNFEITTPMVQGNSITVFEELYHNDVKIGIHPAKAEEGYDKDAIQEQTVEYPTGKTNASDSKTGVHLTEGGQETRVITDRVYFQNLIEGKKYTIEGQLVYQEDFTDKDGVLHMAGEPLQDEGAKASVIFTAGKEIEGAEEVEETVHFDGTKTCSGYITIPFTISTKDLEGRTLVAEETFRTEKGVPVFVHADLKDKPQFIRIPKIHTNAKAGELDEAAVYNEDGSFRTVRITDTVSYENLWTAEDVKKLHEEGLRIRTDGVIIPESPDEVFDIKDEAVYTVKGILMDKETGKPLTGKDGKTYESTVTFTPETADGTIDVAFDVNAEAFVREDGTSLEGKNVVVFEDLYYGKETKEDQHLTDHHDLEDENQDIRFPKGRTHAKAEDTKDNETLASDHVVIHDEVSYENLHGGTEYTVTGTLQVVTEKNEAGQPVKWEAAKDDAGNVITSSTTFKTDGEYEDSVSGTAEVTFEFSGISLAGKTVVAFETCTREGQEVFTHADIKDAPQTVHIPEIKTNATVNGEKKTVAEGTLQVVDRVSFTNLTIGRRYKLKGTLMNKADGKPLMVDGKEVTAEAEFIPEDPDGTVNLTFIFKEDGQIGKYVAFEKLYNLETGVESGTEVAHHEDLEDKDQTVELTRKPLIPKGVQTGDHMTWVYPAVICAGAALGAALLLRKKKKEEQEKE